MILTSQTKNRLLGLGIALCGLLSPWVSEAQSSVVLSVSPTLFEMSATPQQTWSSTVRVVNANSFPITVYAEPVNFAPTGEAGQGTLTPILETATDGETLAEWIDITTEEIVIPPEQTMSVPFSISVPAEATPGGHFAAILIGTRSFDDGSGLAQVETSQVVTSLVFLRVAGDIVESGSIREFRTTRAIYETAESTFAIRFENRGNVHLQPQGDIEITNMWGQSRGTIPVNKNSQFGNVLPESIRTYTYNWSANWSLADVGRHTAVVTLAYGDDTRQFVDATTYFWVIPWKLLLLVLLVLGIFIGLVSWGVKLYVRRMLQLAGVTPDLAKQQHRKRVSVAAPIEAGILDLRSEFTEGTGPFFVHLWHVALRYKVAVLLTLSLLTFAILITWYVVLLFSSDFEYEVSYEQADGTSVPLQTGDADAASEAGRTGTVTELVVINHSASSDAVSQIESMVANLSYVIDEDFEAFGEVKERSVLIYDPALIEQVTELQTALPGILVSSFTSEDTDMPPLVLYIGNDLVN